MIDSGNGDPSYDIVVKIEYRYLKNHVLEKKVPFLFYTALKPSKGFNSYMPKFKLVSI